MRNSLSQPDARDGFSARLGETLLRQVEAWVFDLDNTLYEAGSGHFGQIDRRIGEFIAGALNVGPAEARRVQKDYFVTHGTTLCGLMADHGICPEEYLAFVHDIDLSSLKPDSALKGALDSLPGRCLVFTNGDSAYAARVLDRLGIAECIDGIFDISLASYVPKPAAGTYEAFARHFDVTPSRALICDDMARNLTPAAKMGMRTVWLDNGYPWGSIEIDEAHIDHRINDLSAWLSALAGSGKHDQESS